MEKIREMRSPRNSNIEFLRILTMVGVIILHFNNAFSGGGFIVAAGNIEKTYLLYTLESIFICAVDVFVLISGYFLVNSYHRDLKKPLLLFLQVVILSGCMYLLKSVLGMRAFEWRGFVKSLIPANYFVVLYCVLYLISPYINLIFERLTRVELKKFLILFFLLFSVWPTIVDVLNEVAGQEILGLSSVGMYGSQWGYSLVNFILLYIIGGFLRKYKPQISKKKLYLLLFTCVVIMTLWARLNDKVGFFVERSAWEYCNPFVIIETVCVFLLFAYQKPRQSKIINFISGGSFTVFLTHGHLISADYVTVIIDKPILIILLGYFIYCLVLYFVGFAIYLLYDMITKPIYKKLFKYIKTYKIDLEI